MQEGKEMLFPFEDASSLEHGSSEVWLGEEVLAMGRKIIFSNEDKPCQHERNGQM